MLFMLDFMMSLIKLAKGPNSITGFEIAFIRRLQAMNRWLASGLNKFKNEFHF
jgi:hypothetical protein